MVLPSMRPPLASIIASKRGQKALQVFAIYSLDKLFQAFLIGALKVFLLLWGVLQASASTMLYIELRTMQNYYWQPLTPPINQVIHIKTSVYFIFAHPVYLASNLKSGLTKE